VSLSVNAECVALIEAAAAPIARHRRHRFFERISEPLPNALALSPAAVRDACAQAQREFLIAPTTDVDPPQPSPRTPRSRYERRAR